MAISKISYPISQLTNVENAIKAAIEATGNYDSVTVSNHVITAADGGTTYFTLSIGTTVTLTVYSTATGSTIMTDSRSGISVCWIGTTSKGALIMFKKTKPTLDICIPTSEKKCIVCAHSEYTTASEEKYSFAYQVCADSDMVLRSPWLAEDDSDSDYYTSFTGACAQSHADGIFNIEDIRIIVGRQTSIPNPYTSSGTMVSYSFDGNTYLTDGVLCLAD